MLTILVTGGAGFIGSHFVKHILTHYPAYQVVTLDKLTYAGNLDNLKDIIAHPNHRFIKGDIVDTTLVKELFTHYGINVVVHFAAESHVDNSIVKPDAFIQTNIIGTFQLLEAARQFWQDKKNNDQLNQFRFLHISTDEVYGSLKDDGYFHETSPYAPNSPYSASKASSDMLVRSYHKTYGLNTVITNCSNNFGPQQHDEKLIPTVIRQALAEKAIPIYGQGTNIRDWLYVTDHIQALDKVLHAGQVGETYNIGGEHELNNLALAQKICLILDKMVPRENNESYQSLVTFVADRLGHDFRYAVACEKMKHLGWQPTQLFEEKLFQTVQWYLNKYKN